MLEDVLEGATVEEFGEIFAYFEKKKKLWEEDWAAAWEGQGGAKLGLLRFCNQLMRRLPHGLYIDLTGRILMFLARLFPLSDKSGLNQQGHINTTHPVQVAEEKVRNPATKSLSTPSVPSSINPFSEVQAFCRGSSSISAPSTLSAVQLQKLCMAAGAEHVQCLKPMQFWVGCTCARSSSPLRNVLPTAAFPACTCLPCCQNQTFFSQVCHFESGSGRLRDHTLHLACKLTAFVSGHLHTTHCGDQSCLVSKMNLLLNSGIYVL